ncbi:SDR family oxidoreductase [Spiractinospora alimapuensis]|uniref:SDR family oxidoreductase n=1 Tax=Spiractinospora alimapuensis TaxID=2820884 RepID=UPI001F25F955|nr:SDR family oxidoreductase [Spiractinospora alimapuensis]QVQ53210.1 SDR family oxidoreductase [Spiractinospora alimapuensis]
MGEFELDSGVIGVTGATGAVGQRVAASLARQGLRQRLIIRDLNRAPELPGTEAAMASYLDSATFTRAARDVHTLMLVSATEAPDRVAQHLTAVDAAVEAGVQRIVYLSFLNAAADATFTFARDHFHTEQYIKATGVRWTFLRPSLYLDGVPGFVDDSGVVRGPAAGGRTAWVAREDVAAAATAVLTDAQSGAHDGHTYDLTGPEALTLGDTVSRLSRLTGKTIAYVPETWEEALASRRTLSDEDWRILGWASSYAAIAAGELDTVSPAVSDLTGRPPQSIEGFLRHHPTALAHVEI